MKTRIISGIVMAAVVAGVLALGMLVNSAFIAVFVSLLAAAAVYELLHNAAGITNKAANAGACLYTFFAVCLMGRTVAIPKYLLYSRPEAQHLVSVITAPLAGLSAVYFLFAVMVILIRHKDFQFAQIAALFGFPLPYAFAFAALCSFLSRDNGIYYLLLLLNFSSICDMGAYFIGSAFGKHKLCPNISPKKTVEGAIGGVACSLVFTAVLALAFRQVLWTALVLTLPLCLLGIAGDLFASVIKRSVGIKDYGRLIPGHGGVLDRMDSILMIAPVFAFFIEWGLI